MGKNGETARDSRLFASALLLPLFVAACTVPGMHLGYRVPGNDHAGGAPSADVTKRADVFPINAAVVARIGEEERALEEGLRNAAATRLPAAAGEPYRYRVGVQDVLRITVYDHPELTNPTGTANELTGRLVNSDGTFFFPFVGRIRAAGRTVEEIRDELAAKLAPFVKNPQVDVAVLQHRSQRAFIAGEVARPGAVTLSDIPIRVTDAIANAGGPLAGADLQAVTLTRGERTFNVDLYDLYYRGNLKQNILLQHGDVVNVGEQRFNKVFVLGEVGRPNSLTMPRGRLTLAEALSDSGGVNPFSANSGQIFVIRAQPNSDRPQIFHLNAAAPDALVLADRFSLRARDVVFVDAVAVVRWARVVNNILPTVDVLRETLNDTTRGLPR
jgi:polysaccharide export outer membrane protein